MNELVEDLIFLCVGINTIILILDGLTIDSNHSATIKNLNIVFIVIYAIESLLKIFGFGLSSKKFIIL